MSETKIVTISTALALWFTAQREITRFSGEWAPVLSLAYAVLLVWLLQIRPSWWQRVCQNHRVIMPLFGGVALLSVSVLYPYADGLKELMMGSDQDDAIMLCGQALMRGDYPYLEPTYLGNPPSPAPGMFLIFILSITTGWYPLTTLIFLGLAIWVICQTDGTRTAAQFVAYLSMSLVFWYQLAVGLDLIVMGLLMLLTTKLSAIARTRRHALIIGLLSGVLGATRVVFVFIPFMYSFIVFQRSKQSGVYYSHQRNNHDISSPRGIPPLGPFTLHAVSYHSGRAEGACRLLDALHAGDAELSRCLSDFQTLPQGRLCFSSNSPDLG